MSQLLKEKTFLRHVNAIASVTKVDLTGGFQALQSTLTFQHFIKRIHFVQAVADVEDKGAGAATNKWYFEAGRVLSIDNLFATHAYPNSYTGYGYFEDYTGNNVILQPNYSIADDNGVLIRHGQMKYPLNKMIPFNPALMYGGDSRLVVGSVICWDPELLLSTTPDLYITVNYLIGIEFIREIS